jgi:Na+-transporting NADH:ubiquinone oxidoreductase subunit B
LSFLRRKLDALRPRFEAGGKYHKLWPLFEVIDTFLYSPADETRGSVHVRDAIDLKRVMIAVVLALLPCIFMACWNTGYQVLHAAHGVVPGWRGAVLSALGVHPDASSIGAALLLGALYFFPLYLISNIAGGFWEILFSLVRKKPINEGFLVTGVLYPLILPPDIPYGIAVLGISFGVVMAKEVFGGTGMNFMNVALVSRAFLFFAYPAELSGDRVWVPVDGVSGATALGAAAAGAPIAHSWLDAFLGFIPGSMGETSALACLLGGAYLVWARIASWRIILGMLAGFSLTVLLLSSLATNPVSQLPLHWHLVLGGFAFGTVYMATDPVTAAVTDTGRLIYGALCGILAALIRVINPAFPEGVMLGILLANVFAPLIDYFVIEANKRRRRLRSE